MRLTGEDRERFARQQDAILDRLRRGPVTNRELAQIALKYTSRVSDLRSRGFRIEARRLPRGLVVYTLREGSDGADGVRLLLCADRQAEGQATPRRSQPSGGSIAGLRREVGA
jgi:hypothetical protein